MPGARRCAVVAVAGALACAGTGPARAARLGHPRTPGVFSISPADHELVAVPGAVLTPTLVGNTTGIPVSVSVIPVLLRQSRSGAFRFGTSPRSRRAARRVLEVSAVRFALGGDARHTVLERWRPTAGHHAAYAGVIFRANLHRRTRSVGTVEQLLELDLLAVPGAAPARGRITAVRAADGGPHRVSFTIALRNVGHTFGTPTRVDLRVRTRAGRVIARLAESPGVILPGVTRDFVAQLPRRLPRGSLTVTATAELSGRVSTRSVPLQITAGGELPAASLVPGGVRVTGTAGQHAEVTVPVRNRGTRAGAPCGRVALYRLHGATPASRPVAQVRLTGRALAPGARAEERVAIGRLRAGAYQAVVRYSAPFVTAQPAFIDFAARSAGSASPSLAHWVRAHLALLALGLALLMSLGFSVRRPRRTGAPRVRVRGRAQP